MAAEMKGAQVEQEPLVKDSLEVDHKVKMPQAEAVRGLLVMAVQMLALVAEEARVCPRRLQEPLLLGAAEAVAVVILICQIQTEEPVAQGEEAQVVLVHFQTYLELMAQRTLAAEGEEEEQATMAMVPEARAAAGL